MFVDNGVSATQSGSSCSSSVAVAATTAVAVRLTTVRKTGSCPVPRAIRKSLAAQAASSFLDARRCPGRSIAGFGLTSLGSVVDGWLTLVAGGLVGWWVSWFRGWAGCVGWRVGETTS